MPFDGKDFDLEIDIHTLRRRKLLKALRAPMKDWDWSFGYFKHAPRNECGTSGCALGLAEVLFPDFWMDSDPFGNAANYFGMTPRDALDCFGSFDPEHSPYGVDADQVTAYMVADKIEEVCGK